MVMLEGNIERKWEMKWKVRMKGSWKGGARVSQTGSEKEDGKGS
jgi:hypothetical protein